VAAVKAVYKHGNKIAKGLLFDGNKIVKGTCYKLAKGLLYARLI
jgi:hypothetical protein